MIDMVSIYMNLSFILLASLVFYFIFLMFKLSRGALQQAAHSTGTTKRQPAPSPLSNKHNRHTDAYETRMYSMRQAQTFVGMQLVDLHTQLDAQQIKELDWVKEAVSLYLIGAVDFIGKQAQCSPAGRRELISFVLKSNLDLSPAGAHNYFSEALRREPSSDKDNMICAGAKAAKAWLQEKKIPQHFSLQARIHDWGIFA